MKLRPLMHIYHHNHEVWFKYSPVGISVLAASEQCRRLRSVDRQDGGGGTPGIQRRQGAPGKGQAAVPSALAAVSSHRRARSASLHALFLALCHRSLALARSALACGANKRQPTAVVVKIGLLFFKF